MKVDTYQWVIRSSSPIQQGTFLCGEPWVVDNGDLSLISVSPTPIIAGGLTGGTGSTNNTMKNPDTGKRIAVDPNMMNVNVDQGGLIESAYSDAQIIRVWNVDGTSGGASAGDRISNSGGNGLLWSPYFTGPTASLRGGTIVRGDDFRAGRIRGYEFNTIGSSFYTGNTLGYPSPLEAGDMIITNTGYTGDQASLGFSNGGTGGFITSGTQSGDNSFTESWGILTVLASAPGVSAFRPPINWDPNDKLNRPIYYEMDDLRAGAGGTANLFTYPTYSFTSDTKGWSNTRIAAASAETLMGRAGSIDFFACNHASGSRGSIKCQANTSNEYGGIGGKLEEQMMLHVFDPNTAGATQDYFRRVLTQRGIDIFGAQYSLGTRWPRGGGQTIEYSPKIFWAWAVTGSTAMYNYLDGVSFGAGGSGTNWDSAQKPNEEMYGDYSTLTDQTSSASWGNNACSWRHFDIKCLESSGETAGRHYVKIQRPFSKEDFIGASAGNTYGYTPIWNAVSSTSNAARNWGISNNSGKLIPTRLESGYVRVKGLSGASPYTAISRIVEAELYDENGNVTAVDQNPSSAKLYLQEDIIPIDGGMTGADLSNALQETRPNLLTTHQTYGLYNTGSEAGMQAYQYGIKSGALVRWKLVEIKGGTGSVPYWGQREHRKAVHFASTGAGKQWFVRDYSGYNQGASNPETSLYYALMRQGPAQGVSLDYSPWEYVKGWQTGTTAAWWYDLPETKTWEDINFDLTKIRAWASLNSAGNGANWYRFNTFTGTGGGSAGTTYAHITDIIRTSLTWPAPTGDTRLEIKQHGNNDGASYGVFDLENLGWKAYIWTSGVTGPLGLTLTSGGGHGSATTSWTDLYTLENHLTTENSQVYPSVIFFAVE
jgi:hypothetical protein